MKYSRRDFIALSAAVTGSLPFMSLTNAQSSQEGLSVHIFSKHLQFLDYENMAKAAKAIGFDGVDLTVRPKGHVLPERVEEDLPKAIDAIKKANLQAVMMTTAVDNAKNQLDENVLTIAAKLGIRYYRMNWFRYPEEGSLPEAIKGFQQQIKGLAKLNKKLGLVGCYQNHSGKLVGASLWEVWSMLQKADPEYMGSQYDIRHALVEGGRSWENGLRLIKPHIKTIVLKDFKWEERDGKWHLVNTPIGNGMVDFDAYFKILKANNIQVPVSLHLEYDLGGANHGTRDIKIPEEKVFDAMKRDLSRVRKYWEEA